MPSPATWIEESRRLRGSPLTPDGLSRLGAALGEPVSPCRPLHGGVASSVWLVETPTRRLVLKRFMAGDGAGLEWERLLAARSAPVCTPEPVLLDAGGDWFGSAALVVTYIDGDSMNPPQPAVLGELLARIHATPVPRPVPPALLRPALWVTWAPRVEFPPGLVEGVRRLQALAPTEPSVLSHGDFHPGNVIVAGGAVAGVVDWSSCRVTPAGLDVAFARCDLAIEPGGDAPDVFLGAYEEATGRPVAHRQLWDLLAAARALEDGEGWVEAWTDVGIPMTADRIHERVTAFADAALRSLDAEHLGGDS